MAYGYCADCQKELSHDTFLDCPDCGRNLCKECLEHHECTDEDLHEDFE
jgi:predicted amidophosphoribosyltransferase